jgi:hypothetical protein
MEAIAATGNPALDALLKDVAKLKTFAALATPEGSFDRCKNTATWLVAKARTRGLAARVVQLADDELERTKMDPRWQSCATIYHYVPEIAGLVVDFTARQFDPQAAFPVICPLTDLRSDWGSAYDSDDFTAPALWHPNDSGA